MKKCKKFLSRLLFPPIWVVVISIVLTTLLLMLVFIKEYEDSVFSYFIYAFSAYSLCIFIAFIISNFDSTYKKILKKFPLVNRYISDKFFRAHISIYAGLTANTVYSVFYFVMAVLQKSYWHITLAIYNLIFSIMRFLLIKSYNKAKKEKNVKNRQLYELRSYRLCGIFMFLMSITMTGMIELLISNGKNSGGEIITITIAAYTFYCFIIAIINVFKFKKQNSPILSASKNVCFARALMSLFSLQITMFAQFDESSNGQMQYIMNILLGLAVCTICIAIAVIMIIKSNKNIKSIKGDNYCE